MRTSKIIKLVVGLAALFFLPWLFFTTLQDTIAQPYDANGFPFSGWTLTLNDGVSPGGAALGLQPPTMLPSSLFDQLFERTMTSMTTPGGSVMPIVLRSELRGEVGTVLALEEILEMARAAGLERVTLDPVCMAVKRQPFSGRTRELYFVVFDSPETLAFRRHLHDLVAERGVDGAFTDDRLDLVLPIAGSDARFDTWWPLEVDLDTDCQAPILWEPLI